MQFSILEEINSPLHFKISHRNQGSGCFFPEFDFLFKIMNKVTKIRPFFINEENPWYSMCISGIFL